VTRQLIKVDASASSTVWVCSLCGTRDIATARAFALREAAAHVELVHSRHGKLAAQLAQRADRATAK
jgi:hypothetical protein